MANSNLNRQEHESNLTQAGSIQIDNLPVVSTSKKLSCISAETEQARQAVINVILFFLLWLGSAVVPFLLNYSWQIKAAIILIAFPVWGCFINRFVIGWTSSLAGPKLPS